MLHCAQPHLSSPSCNSCAHSTSGIARAHSMHPPHPATCFPCPSAGSAASQPPPSPSTPAALQPPTANAAAPRPADASLCNMRAFLERLRAQQLSGLAAQAGPAPCIASSGSCSAAGGVTPAASVPQRSESPELGQIRPGIQQQQQQQQAQACRPGQASGTSWVKQQQSQAWQPAPACGASWGMPLAQQA